MSENKAQPYNPKRNIKCQIFLLVENRGLHGLIHGLYRNAKVTLKSKTMRLYNWLRVM